MNTSDNHPIIDYQSMLGESPLSDDELMGLRRKAWEEQDILIVSIHDLKLQPVERLRLRLLGNRLFRQEDNR